MWGLDALRKAQRFHLIDKIRKRYVFTRNVSLRIVCWMYMPADLSIVLAVDALPIGDECKRCFRSRRVIEDIDERFIYKMYT